MQIDTNPRSLGMAGGALVAIGTFMPIVSLPFYGNVTFMQNGHGYGIVMLAAGIAGALLAHRGSGRGMTVSAIVAGAMMVAAYIGIQMRIQQIVDAIGGKAGGLFSGLVGMAMKSIQMQWGWGVLMLGTGLLLYSGSRILRA